MSVATTSRNENSLPRRLRALATRSGRKSEAWPALALPAEAAAYVETIYQWPAFRRWYQAAVQEVQG